jgi:hypothetical protein
MIKKRKKRKKPINKPEFNIPNFAIIGLSLIISIALFSAVDKLFYSDNKEEFKENLDLGELLMTSNYEKETGHKINIQLLNGCGEKNLAESYNTFFLTNGHDVLEKKNAPHFEYPKTKIISRIINLDPANNIATLLGIPIEEVELEIDNNQICDITLILGKDYSKLTSFDKVLEINPFINLQIK